MTRCTKLLSFSILMSYIQDIEMLLTHHIFHGDQLQDKIIKDRVEKSSIFILSLLSRKIIKVNGHRLKHFYEGFSTNILDVIPLDAPVY